ILAHFAAHTKNDFLGTAQMFQKAFADRPETAVSSNDRWWNRPLYFAACCAAKASQEKPGDQAHLTRAGRATWRRKSLEWLRQELAYWDKQAAGKAPSDRARVARVLVSWQGEGWLAGVRDAQELAKLQPAEREACLEFWDDVAKLLRQTR